MSSTTNPLDQADVKESQNGATPPGSVPLNPLMKRDDPDSVELARALLDDFKWAFEQRMLGSFEQYRGQHIAVVNRQVMGSGVNEDRLVESVCAQHHLSPDRVIVLTIDPPDPMGFDYRNDPH